MCVYIYIYIYSYCLIKLLFFGAATRFVVALVASAVAAFAEATMTTRPAEVLRRTGKQLLSLGEFRRPSFFQRPTRVRDLHVYVYININIT